MIDTSCFKNINISRLGLGTMRLPVLTSEKRENNPNIDYDEGFNIVDLAYQNGVNYFDTAYMYHGGKSEEFIGKALKKYPRNTYFVADKLPIWMCDSKSDMQRIFDEQLSRTGLDYFDFYLLHSLDDENFSKCEKFNAYEFLEMKREEGKIKNIGFSFHGTIDDLKNIVSSHKWDFAQIQMNYLDWENQDAKTQYDILTNAGIPVFVMEPVRGGKLANVPIDVEKMFKQHNPNSTTASWAIKFVASFDNVVTILSGMNSREQLLDNVNSLTDFIPFDNNEFKLCEKAASVLNNPDLIQCTGCDYCANCPKHIKISSVFSVYNQFKSGEINIDEANVKFSNIKNNASDCVGCGFCESHCPQSIEISKWMKTIKKIFD